ncbi:hypothetical protein ACSNOK_24400 [Streptomyces sp. URMC 126]|uniref:hypothetical protein n=1 Tax=Streptomyces sp. URMC 126 TaxID=3423401 RepID=UPI003F1DACCD
MTTDGGGPATDTFAGIVTGSLAGTSAGIFAASLGDGFGEVPTDAFATFRRRGGRVGGGTLGSGRGGVARCAAARSAPHTG